LRNVVADVVVGVVALPRALSMLAGHTVPTT
jgi:hypothetical protein